MEFVSFRITTDGDNFRLEGKFIPNKVELQWLPVSSSGWYCGCNDYGFCNMDGHEVFKSKQDAKDFLKNQYGEIGLKKLVIDWVPC